MRSDRVVWLSYAFISGWLCVTTFLLYQDPWSPCRCVFTDVGSLPQPGWWVWLSFVQTLLCPVPSPILCLNINLKYERMLRSGLCLQYPRLLPPGLLSAAACHCNFMVNITDSSPPLNQSYCAEYVKGIQAFCEEPAS